MFDLTWVEKLLQPYQNLDLLIFPLLIELFLHEGLLDIEDVRMLHTIRSHSVPLSGYVDAASIRYLRATSHRLRVIWG